MEEEKNKTFKEWRTFAWKEYKTIIIIAFIALVFIACIIAFNYFAVNKDTDNRGSFGDLFGFSNAVFSALAFLGVIITIILQMQELKEQREELKLTRKEFNQQNETLSLQRFENTFFQLLGVHHGIVENMEYKSGSHIFFKRNIFNQSFELYLSRYFLEFNKLNPSGYFKVPYWDKDRKYFTVILNKDNLLEIESKIHELYADKIYPELQNNFGHYFRNLYRIFKFIDNKEFYSLTDIKSFYEDIELNKNELAQLYNYLNDLKKYEYAAMVRAQLSDYELWWLTFNCLWKGGENFKVYVEKYTLLNNHPNESVLEEMIALGLFNSWALTKENNPFLYNFAKYKEKQDKQFGKHPTWLDTFSQEEDNYMRGAELMSRFLNEKK